MATLMSFQPICGCLNRCSSAYIARKGESHDSDVPLKTGSDCIDVRKRGRSYFFMFHQIIGHTSDINSDIITPNKIKTQIDASGQHAGIRMLLPYLSENVCVLSKVQVATSHRQICPKVIGFEVCLKVSQVKQKSKSCDQSHVSVNMKSGLMYKIFLYCVRK